MRRLMTLALIMLAPVIGEAASGNLIMANETGLAYNTTYFQNLNQFGYPNGPVGKLSAQVTWTSTTFSSSTFTDGTQSTATITVNSSDIFAKSAADNITVPASVLATPATAQLTVVSNTGLGSTSSGNLIVISTTGLTNAIITLNGATTINLLNGVQWLTGVTPSTTATNLAAAIDLFTGQTNLNAFTTGYNEIYCTSTITGLAANNYTITSSTVAAISSTTFSGALANAVITINGNTLVQGTHWTAQSTTSGTATSIAGAINTYLGNTFTANTNVNTSVVYTTADQNGYYTNSYSELSSTPAAISTTAFSGGSDDPLLNAYITFNGNKYKNGYQWTDASGTSTGTAISIATFMDTFTNIIATAAGSVVYATATPAGLYGNSYTLTSSTAALVVASATFAGGQDSATVTVNGTSFIAAVNFSTGSTTSVTATRLAVGLNASSATTKVTWSAVAAVVTGTSNVTGLAANYLLASSTQAALSLSNPEFTSTVGASTGVMTGGTSASYLINTSTINVPSHGFTKALQVVYSTNTAGVTISGLTAATTYYVVVIDSNNIALATSSTGAVQGLYVTITSSAVAVSSHTFALTPVAFVQGQASGQWQVSNDGKNWANFATTSNNVAVSSQTFIPVLGSTTAVQDFGQVDFGYLRYNALGPTSGGVLLKVIVGAKD